ncbi:MAG TPA: PilN domain-containing protein [Armatimonadaceae bacterium]|nr:PilN domain-containing protein [Armatimonadaceae bacterium]
MSGGSHRQPGPSLHVEWSPGFVRAVDVASGRSAQGANLAEVASVLDGHREALVGAGRGVVFLKGIRLPKAAPADLRQLLAVRVGQLFPLPSDQLAFDFFQTADQNAEGVLTIVAAIRAQDLAQIRAEFQQAGVRVSRVMPVALGAPAVARRAGVESALVVEDSPGGWNLDVVQDGTLRFSRVAPAAGDLSLESQRTLAAAGAGSLSTVAAGKATGLDALGADGMTPLHLLGEAQHAFAFERPEERAAEEKKRVATKTRFAALMAVSAALLATFVWVEHSDAGAEVKRSEGVWARELSKVRSIRDAEIGKVQRVTAIQSSLKRALEPAQPISDVAMVVGDSLPPSVWLSGLSVERGKPVQIRGTATRSNDVAALVDSLAASPRFRDVKLVFANSGRIEETPVVQFSITATAVGNLPMPAPVKTSGKATARTASAARSTATGGGAEGGAAR